MTTRPFGIDLERQVEIHMEMIQFFRDGNQTTVAEIAERYGIGNRTAQRYLCRIQRWVPLERRGPNYRKQVFK